MFTEWLRNYFTKQVRLYGDIDSVNYLSHGLPRNWVIRNGVFIEFDSK
jgi:hypothetical protein